MKFRTLVFLMALTALGCSPPADGQSLRPSKDLDVAKRQPTEEIDDRSFKIATIRVVDDATSSPIRNAKVLPVCLGRSKYANSHDISDHDGYAEVYSWDGEYVAAQIQIDGYEPMTKIVPRKDPVMRLKAMQN